MIWLFNIIIRTITITAMIGLLGSYTTPHVDPNLFYPSSLLGLAYPYLLIANAILFIYWILRRKKIAIAIFITLAVGYPLFSSYYGLNAPALPDDSHDLSILTYNIRMLSAFGENKKQEITKQTVNYINKSNSDVICLQEFPRKESLFQKFPSHPYHYNSKDVALISRFPIVNSGNIPFDKSNSAACIYCDITIGKDTIRIYTVHLESYRLGQKEQRIYKNLTSGNTENATQGVKTISSRLVTANRNRAKQAITIKEHALASPYPVIICGDFNDTPISYSYHTLASEMQDCFIEKGSGVGNTYIGIFPSFRIDHILHTTAFKSVYYNRGAIEYSDHYPVLANLKFSQSK